MRFVTEEDKNGFTLGVLLVGEVWETAKLAYPKPEHLIEYMDNFFLGVYARTSGLPVDLAHALMQTPVGEDNA